MRTAVRMIQQKNAATGIHQANIPSQANDVKDSPRPRLCPDRRESWRVRTGDPRGPADPERLRVRRTGFVDARKLVSGEGVVPARPPPVPPRHESWYDRYSGWPGSTGPVVPQSASSSISHPPGSKALRDT